MPVCSVCGNQTGFLDLRDGKCGSCRAKEKDAAAQAVKAEATEAVVKRSQDEEAASKIMVTTEAIAGMPISERLGVVSGERVFGLNALKDIFVVGARDVFGGKSKTAEKAFSDARADAIAAMQMNAFRLGADAIVGASFTHSGFGEGGGGMVLVVATGTAVRLAN